MTHGTRGTYQYQKCRCSACKEAARMAQAHYRRMKGIPARSRQAHGVAVYRRGCRCDVCRYEWRTYHRNWRQGKQKKVTQQGLYDAG